MSALRDEEWDGHDVELVAVDRVLKPSWVLGCSGGIGVVVEQNFARRHPLSYISPNSYTEPKSIRDSALRVQNVFSEDVTPAHNMPVSHGVPTSQRRFRRSPEFGSPR